MRNKSCQLDLFIDGSSFINNEFHPHISIKFLNFEKSIDIKDSNFIDTHINRITMSILRYISGYLSDEFVCTQHANISKDSYYVTISW